MEENINNYKDKLMIFTFASLALSLVSTITYMIYTIATNSSFIDHIISIIGVIILVIVSILLVVAGFFMENKKAKIFISIASLILAFYSCFQIITDIVSPKDFMLDFTDVDIKEVISWAKERDIKVVQTYKYSDEIEEFHVIKQDVKKGTPVKDITSIKVTVSNGIDPSKKAEVTNMVGWKLDDVIKFIDDNHLTNVTINFEFNPTVEKDIIISQDIIKEIRRNEPVTLVSSLGKESEFPSVTLENLIGMDTFHALIYLGRNNIKYSIEYQYSDTEKEGTVLKQSIRKWTVISPNYKDTLIVTIAKQNEVTVPDLSKMSEEEITDWATKNRIRINFSEEYDEKVKSGKVISYGYPKGTNIEIGTLIEVILSKGQIKMIEFTNLLDFRKWAEEYNVNYSIDYQYSDTVDNGKLISSSHKKGDTIKNSDTVKLVISQGGNTVIPNLIDLTKDEAERDCSSAKIKCSFIYLDNNKEYTKVTKQSMAPGSTVPQGTSITVTIGK